MSTVPYPVHVEAELDDHLNRWLWLVKWVLAIPHYVVLVFLWMAFALLSIAAFFAILFTGRYPRAIFDFNVGVLRWHWRVSCYAYGALATDRYPPFTLRDVPDYPARLDVDFPERLSRGLVLVKWWLLAIPHYLVLAVLLGGGVLYLGSADDGTRAGALGLIPLLVLVAGVALLVRGRYPRGIFDLVLGLNRWALRVAGYAALMTDSYPPFRLDQGGHEPSGPATLTIGTPPSAVSTPPPASPPSPPSPRGPSWTTGRVVSVIAGCLVGLGAVGLAVPGFALLVADQVVRDDEGFVMSPEEYFSSTGYAIVSEDVRLHADGASELTPAALLGDVRVTALGDGGTPVFVGVAPADDVRGYLDGVEHVTLVDLRDGDPVYRETPGGRPGALPDGQDIWVAQSSGTGLQELTWSPDDGKWALVVMNADASADVAVTMAAGAEVPAMPWVIGVLLTLAALGLVAATLLIVLPLRAVSRDSARMP